MKKADRLKLYSSKIANTIEGRDSFVVFYNSRVEKGVKLETFGQKFFFLVSIPLSTGKNLEKSEIRELKSIGFEKNNFPISYGTLLGLEGVGLATAHSIYQKFWDSRKIDKLDTEELQEISGIDKETAGRIEKSYRNEISDLPSKDYFSLQKKCSPEKVVELVETIFERGYSLPDDYSVSFDLYSGEIRCFMCGSSLSRIESTTNEISIKRAREIGVSEEKIKNEIEKRISLLKVIHFDKPRKELMDMIKVIRKKGLIYPRICHTCSSLLPFYPTSVDL